MRGRKQGQPPKKKVNGFIGYRSYYSALFSRLQQKQRSPIMTTLWKQDPFHGEWDLMCGTYSAIRPLLAEQNISFQMWIAYAVGPLGIVARDRYMATMGWMLAQDENGSYKLERTGAATVECAEKLMSGLNLLMQCLKNGLPFANPRQMIKILSNRSSDVMHIRTSTFKADDSVLAVARHNRTLATSRLFEIPIDQAMNHGWVAQQNARQNAQHRTEPATRSKEHGDGMDGQDKNGI